MAMSIIKELLHKSDASGSKSTILKPLTWLISVITGGIILLLEFNSPNWLIIMFSIIMGVAILIFFFSYIYCLFTDKDAIRSEKYSIQKLAIEKGLYGDNVTGILIQDQLNFSDNKLKIENSEEGILL
ncbi:MAG: hypothetical protein A2041_14620 [Bacteroidetes bacterium GWA2_31_9b]|nr:MAG: hypothetical protein A2041_14620 [Bacteroidetes bacterium GWA2_31_9b]